MNSRHPQSKHNTGEVRGDLPQAGRWYEDRAMSREINREFTAAAGMVPTNPSNYYSAKAKPSPFRYDAISDGLTTRISPYGDGREFAAAEEPILTKPGPTASLIAAADPAANAAAQVNTPGYGYGQGSTLDRIDAAQQKTPAGPMQAKGMSTGLALGGGPQRNVPKPA